ncbi:ribokinase [Enterococcus silesiacus]|nr:ribokinase [Enterococcus silesiacus]
MVLTSLNVDYTIKTTKIPEIGETVVASDLIENFGGKGANQLLGIHRLGVDTIAFGKVGKDALGEKYLHHLQGQGINTTYISQGPEKTGLAFIVVDEAGQNNICILPGANGSIDQTDLDNIRDKIADVDIIVSQLEVPIAITNTIFSIAKKLNKITVLNPAPFKASYKMLLKNTDILVPNESEFISMTNLPNKQLSQEDILQLSPQILNEGPSYLIVTMGGAGVLVTSPEDQRFISAKKVAAIDTTAAGDSFIGGLVSQLVTTKEAMPTFEQVVHAAEFGNKVAALTVQKNGAQDSLPTLKEVTNYWLDK